MIYPDDALKSKIEGVVKAGYDVDVFGKVSKATIIKGIGYGCDEEALRLINLLRFPKHKYPGRHIVFHQILNIRFQIFPAKAPVEQQIVYLLKQEDPDHNEPRKITYSITIN